ncbi:hypothetical protein ABW20_dc0106295 [Dactylellina cionopaga]|nr:hypothetical protein ABW20_dc0106295 [Dactylellina cionopaga]
MKHRHRIAGLPSISEVLRILSDYGINDDKLWADVMFDYIRTEYYDDAIELWQDKLECQKDNPLVVMNTTSTEDTDPAAFLAEAAPTKSKPGPNGFSAPTYDSHYYPAVAALTAFLYSRRLVMMPTELGDLLQFIAPNGEDVSNLLPPSFGVANILRENDISPDIVESTIVSLEEFRPYSNDNSKEYTVMFDKVFLAASHWDLETVRSIYEESKTLIPGYKRGRSYYISFINAVLQCNSREDGEIIWRDMLQAGVIPTIKTWASWLDGCAKAKNIELFQQGWETMEASGFTADTICWTIRMQMLFLLNDPESAKLCLQHMVNNNVPLTTNTVNIAVEKLNKANLFQDAFDLIQWATQAGTEMDIVTYNLILESRTKLGDFNGVLKVLNIMTQTGIRADIISYGAILRGMYKYGDTLPDIRVLQSILSEIQSKGIQPNIQFYNTIIHSMLTRWSDIKGALYVLSIMPNDAWRGSSVTSSIFITYYARTGNLPAIEEVWANMRRNTLAPDEAVYGATVMAYSMSGVKDKMLEYLEVMGNQRKRIRVITYIWALRCLMTQRDYIKAQEILNLMHSRGVDLLANKELREIIGKLKEVATDEKRNAFMSAMH